MGSKLTNDSAKKAFVDKMAKKEREQKGGHVTTGKPLVQRSGRLINICEVWVWDGVTWKGRG